MNNCRACLHDLLDSPDGYYCPNPHCKEKLPGMKIRELIAELGKYDPESVVEVTEFDTETMISREFVITEVEEGTEEEQAQLMLKITGTFL